MFNYTNPIAEAVLEFLEEHNIEYIMAGSNNTHIVISNRGTGVRMFAKKKVHVSWAYWIKDIRSENIFEFDSVINKYPYYTEFTRRDMYDLLMLTENVGYVEEKDVKSAPGFGGKTISLSLIEKMIVKQTIMYVKKMYHIITSLDISADDMKRMSERGEVDQTNVEIIYENLKAKYVHTTKKIKEISIGKTTRQEIVNSFSF